MNTLQTLFLLTVGLSVAQGQTRNLFQFRDMILCLMPTSWPVMDYTDYGCYCGYGGSGTPVDALDRCCKVHDECYDRASAQACTYIWDSPYIEWYSWTCHNNKRNKRITCDKVSNGECEMLVCECDRKASECFAASPWNPDNENISSDRCQDRRDPGDL